MDSTTLKLAPSLGLSSIGLYFLGTYWAICRRGMGFPPPFLPLLQLPSYLVPQAFISTRAFIIPKSQNIYWRKFICRLFSLYIEHLPNNNCSFRRPNFFYDGTFTKHLCRALPTEIIFYLLRSTPSYLLICDSGEQFYILGIIVQWLQVSDSECNRQTPLTKNPICVQGLGSDRPSDLYDRFRHELLQFREPRKSKIWEGTSGTVHWPSLEH